MQRDEGGGSQRRPVQHGAAGPQQRQRLRSTAQHEDERLLFSEARARGVAGVLHSMAQRARSSDSDRQARDRGSRRSPVLHGVLFSAGWWSKNKTRLIFGEFDSIAREGLDDGGVVSREDCFRIRGERGSK